MSMPSATFLRTALAGFLFLGCLTSTRPAHGQADISVELSHIQRLNDEGRWLEALDETGRLMQGMAKQVRTIGPLSNSYYTFAVLRARFAAWAGDLDAAEKAIKGADSLGTDLGFRRLLAAMAPPDKDGNEEAKQRRREYEVGILMRDFVLDDAKTGRALAGGDLDEAEALVNTNFQKRRAGGGSGRLLAVREKNERAVISPQKLAAVSTFEPSRLAALLYVKKEQISRARSYLLDAEQAAAAVLRDAFPVDDDGRRMVPEWPTDGSNPSRDQREATRLRAAARQLRGAVEAASGNFESAEAAFGEAIDLWQRGYDQEHPEALPALLGNARLAVERAEQAKERRDVKTAASRAKKAERLLATAGRLMDAAVATASPQRAEWQELTDRTAALDSSSADISALEAAEKAAREALRSLSKYKTPGGPMVTRPATVR